LCLQGRVKIVTLNFWGSEPPLDKRLALATRQLAALAPDVVCLQEARAETTRALAGALGMHGHFAISTQWNGIEEGLAILSGDKPVDTRKLVLPVARPDETRSLLSAKLADIWVHTTHLHYRLDDGVAREAQVLAIDAEIRALGRDNTSSPQILCGDFN